MADAQLVLSPLVRVTDANNQPIAGGELRFYEAGTSTPLVVYADSDLLVALGSTVNTDDGGYPISGGSAKTLIWTGPNEYKVVVHDADGVPLVTHDNIRGALVVPEAAEASYPKTPVITRTTTTVISTDYESYRGRLINANPGGGSFVITLPSAVTVEDGFRIGVRHAGTSNTVTIRTIGTQVIATIGQAALKSFALTGLGNTVWLVSNGADWIVDTEVPALINNSYFIVADRLTSPPGSPVAGTRYIINGMPAGAWSTLSFDENDIAEADGNGSWFRYVPRDGYLAYVADENLLTQWRDSEWVDLTNITAPTESQLQYAVFEHQVSNGTNGGTATTGAWTTRTLNTTVINSITGASLGSNAITLPVGKYLVLAQQAFFSREAFDTSVGGRFVAQQRINAGTAVLAANSLYGIAGTVGTTLSVGSATGNGDTTYAPTDMFVLDVTTAGTINLQYYTTNGQSNTALGLASTEPSGAQESYARVTVLSLTSLQGPQGIQGSQGNAATIAVGTVTTVAPSVPAAVTNSGTSGAAVFDFNIPKGDPGQDGGQGASGGAVLAYFEWNDATSGDPGSGGVLANNATLASATEVNISKTGPNGEDYSAFLASWAVSTAPLKGHLRINTAADLSEFIDADVTGFTDNSTYVTIALTNVTGAGTPTASDMMSVVFMRSGDLGSISVPNYTALKALPTTGAVIVTDTIRGGTFVWRTGDYSGWVTLDTAAGVYVPSDSDSDGSSGCWVRQYSGPESARWFGATGDGVSDDYAALMAAIAFSYDLYLPAGTYLTSAALELGKAIRISGDGPEDTHVLLSAGTVNVFQLTMGASDVFAGVGLENMHIGKSGSGDPQYAFRQTQVEGGAIYSLRIRNIFVDGCKGGVRLNSLYYSLIEDLIVDDVQPGFAGLWLQGVGGASRVGSLHLTRVNIRSGTSGGTSNPSYGILISSYTEGVYASQCTTESAGLDIGLMILNGAGAPRPPENLFFSQLVCDTSNLTCMVIADAYSVHFVDSWFSSAQGVDLINDCGYGIWVQGGTDITFTAPRVYGCATDGVRVDGSVSYITFDSPTVIGNSARTSGDYYGMAFRGGASHFSVRGGRFSRSGATASHEYSVVVYSGGGDYYIIEGNNLTGAVAGGLLDAGGGSNKVVANNLGA